MPPRRSSKQPRSAKKSSSSAKDPSPPKGAQAANSALAHPSQPPTIVNFPALSKKNHLNCYSLDGMEDHILLVDEIFNLEECRSYINLIESLPLGATPPKKKREAERVNQRLRIDSPEFAKTLYEVLSPHLPLFPPPPSTRKSANSPRPPHSLNTNIRLYKYGPGQYFGPHYDDSVRDTITGAKSEWTLLVYLSGVEDGVKGGETLFYKEHRGKPTEIITPPLKRGMALLHRHGHACLLHEGSLVTSGVKYVLRSDLMFA